MLSKRFRWIWLSLILAVGLGILLAAGCGAATPEVVEVEKVVEKPVVQTVVVEKEKVVKETVVETVVVEKEKPVEVEKIVTQVVEKEVVKEVVVTPTPSPLPRGGELVVGCSVEPETIDPHVGERGNFCSILNALYDTLLVKSVDGEYLPWLATSWEVSDDSLHYTFKLREDVKFHDGTPFNAEAVCFNFDRMVDPATESRWSVQLVGPYDSCEVLDEYTARVNLKETYGPFFEALTKAYLGMVSPTAVQRYGTDFEMNQVGTGPFRWVEHVLKDHLTLERNPDYNWAPEIAQHQGPAYLDRLTFRFIPEPATRVGAVEIGEVHIVNDAPSRDAARLGTNHALVVYNNDIPARARHYAINTSKPPTDDLNVRKAMEMAIDRSAVSDTLFQSLWRPAYSLFGPKLIFFDQSVEDKYAREYAYDPEKAGALLDEAGWEMGSDGIREKDGQPLKINMIAASMKEVHELIQAQLREVGIDMEIEMRAPLDFLSSCGEGKANMCFLGGRTTPDPGLSISGFFRIGAKYDWTKHHNERLDELLDMAVKTADPAKRQEMYSEAQDILMADALILPVFQPTEIYVARAEVKGLTFDDVADPLFYDVYLAE